MFNRPIFGPSIAEVAMRLVEATSIDLPFHLTATEPAARDFRRQALKPSKWREYRAREREKNRASMKAMGLGSNVFGWPGTQQPEWAKAKLDRKHIVAI
ncbi:hypothetical protein [Thalassospira tepidiphila]|uniref:Uncharacterized protein n=2 Tax=Thalassospira tepidiphila TaxID=393657 RepID=A0A853KWB8_9PROT|nr:hypothetical protein [Thalassospira tepidiphila]NJB74596.1 hypothetical protein [Thalassospira tepidiphila]OAZ08072.1 hypothetical protein TH4_18650 [Thalassospira tepidiphila MCCC 1A03514]